MWKTTGLDKDKKINTKEPSKRVIEPGLKRSTKIKEGELERLKNKRKEKSDLSGLGEQPEVDSSSLGVKHQLSANSAGSSFELAKEPSCSDYSVGLRSYGRLMELNTFQLRQLCAQLNLKVPKDIKKGALRSQIIAHHGVNKSDISKISEKSEKPEAWSPPKINAWSKKQKGPRNKQRKGQPGH